MHAPDASALEAKFSEGLELHRQGRLADAEYIYQAVLRWQPNHVDALHLLGVIALQTGRIEQAVELIGKAIALKPDIADAHSNHGTALQELGRTEEAIASYDKAITLRPDYVEAYYNRANSLMRLKRLEEAVRSYEDAIALRPDYAEAYYNRGTALQALTRHAEALASYDKVIGLKPDFAEAYSNRGTVLQELSRPEAALASYDQAIALKPDYAEAYSNRGNALQALNRTEEALACYRQAIALKPDYAEAYYNLGNTLQKLNRPDDAIPSYDEAIAQRPDYAEAYYNRANALQALNRREEAIASYDTAVALKLDYAEAYSNRGNVLQELNRPEAASTSYDKAIALRPGYAQARFNSSLCRLKLGDLSRGWSEYEWRWMTPQMLGHGFRKFHQPLWLGKEQLAGKTILLHAEQGFGDTLQFCRYALPVAARGAHVVLAVPDPLVRLMASLGVGNVAAFGDPLPPFDLHCPLMSLPLAFQTTIETIPSKEYYLAADPVQAAAWRQRLAGLPGRRVGLVWAGSARRHAPELMAVDRRRSITLAHLAPLAGVPGISFVSLQKGEPATQTRLPPPSMHVHDFTDELVDFADTAALVAALDLVISVDTAVAHLAGALGTPVWILNRFDSCWRWLIDRTDSPWYPTARLFRQPAPGDWDSVIAQVIIALQDWMARATAD